ncbi:helix-turn-helix domain-containing protein [Halobellus rufus]|uniref:helix-turn-helix domain-containing protein n=1 Tax=Halobellus rufus TaxID=1448860 RepID=UPI0006789F22|nr:helix-turn-helix domain-containing protein [Halobellus rufus]
MSERAHRERADAVLEVEFILRDSNYPFVRVSEAESCTFELAEMIARDDGRYAEFFNVTGVDPDRVTALAAEHETAEASLLSRYEDGGLFEFSVSGDCPAHRLAELGALPRSVRAEAGEGRIVAEIPSQYDPGPIVDAFLATHPDAELAGKQEKGEVSPMFPESTHQRLLQDVLTDRQREVIDAAFEAGYYEWPRETTGQEVADGLGISSATFSEHIHAAERKLLTALLAEL